MLRVRAGVRGTTGARGQEGQAHLQLPTRVICSKVSLEDGSRDGWQTGSSLAMPSPVKELSHGTGTLGPA